MKVYLNAGHAADGYPDPGACNEELGLEEWERAKVITDLVEKYLISAGVEVVGNLQADSLAYVVSEANDSDADIFISIHCNAFDGSAKGTEVCVYPNSYVGKRLGQCVQNQIVNSLDMVDRGLKVRIPGVNGLYVLTNTDMPAILVETAFIDNYDDGIKLRDRADDFARAIARGVTDYQVLYG